MATAKTRINISIPQEVKKVLSFLAKRDEMPEATKASHLLQLALEIEEDQAWDAIALNRDKRGAKLVPHKKAWG